MAVLVLTPAVRPFRWSRLFWTYVVPVLPLAILFDGLVSCLRTYTSDEMLVLGHDDGGEEYKWEAGFVRPAGSPLPIPYLLGVPRTPPNAEPARPFGSG